MSSAQSSKELINSSKDNGSSIIIMTHNGKKVSKREMTDNKLLHNKETNDLNSRSFINSSEYAEDIDKFEKKNKENIDYTYEQLISIAREDEKMNHHNESLKIYNNILENFQKKVKLKLIEERLFLLLTFIKLMMLYYLLKILLNQNFLRKKC